MSDDLDRFVYTKKSSIKILYTPPAQDTQTEKPKEK